MTTVEAVASADATVYDSPSNASNFSNRTTLWAQGTQQRRPFIFVAVPFPAGSNITSAKLRLTQDRVEASASRTISVQLVSKQWSESKLTWDNQPAVTGPVASVTVTGAGTAGRVIEVDVTALMQSVSDGTAWYGFRVVNSSASGIYFRAREATTGKPTLVVDYSQAPSAPSSLSPSAGRAVSLARPTLGFDFTDRTGTMSAYQVQLFDGVEGATLPSGMSERFASFNYNGIDNSGTWATRKPGIISTMFGSGAKVIGCQEANSTAQPDEPGQIRTGLNAASGSSGLWQSFIGPNLNVIFVDTAVFTPQWAVTVDKALGDGKYASAMLLQHVASGARLIFWTTHYLTSGFLTEQRKHTKVLTGWLASLTEKYGVPLVGGGDFNAKSRAAADPMGILALAGQIDVRDLIDPESIVNRTYDSLDSYTTNLMRGFWIDHLFTSGGPVPTAVGLRDSGTASDHNLIYADIDYVTQAASVPELGIPTQDTGTVLSTVPQHTLTSDVALDSLVWWRVRVRDELEWSAWSDPTYFTRVAKPTLTITNPAASPNDFVSEPTPPLAWTSANQVAYRVLITDPVDPTNVKWDSLRQGGPDQSLTPPTSLPLQTGQQYRLEVRTEDAVTREATPLDPVYQSAERLFTFALTNTVSPVTALTVTQPTERPWASVGFTMTTASDSVEVLRDGVSLGTFAPAALLVSGTTYAFVDRFATPYRDHTWTVRRIVNGQTSSSNPTATAQVKAVGVWLSLPDGSLSVCMSGDEATGSPVVWSADEVVEMFRPMGATRAQVVTHAVFGREGKLGGYVTAIPGITYEQQRAAWYALSDRKAYPYGTEMVLTQSDGVSRVFWTGVLTTERDEYFDEFAVSATLNEII